MDIADIAPGSPALDEVIALGKRARKWLGFLPDAGFDDRARRGTLIAAVVRGRVVAYALYDLPGDRVKLVHLCVAEQHRRAGVAQRLVEEISARHGARRGIEVRCRRDFPAHGLWPALGFRPVMDRPGRSQAGHLLAVWFKDHGNPDLFTLAPTGRELAAVDHNVFQDLVTARPQGAASRHLLEPWVRELVDLAITDQVPLEINQCDDESLRSSMLEQTASFRRMHAGSEWRRLVSVVAGRAPRAQDADHRHVAMAAAAGAAYFVTRDGALIRQAKPLEAELALVILRPEDLIVRMDRLRAGGNYEPRALLATQIVESGAADVDQDEFIRVFLNHGAGERAATLRVALRDALATPDAHDVRVFRDGSRRPLGAVIRAVRDERLDVLMIRVRPADVLGASIARQLAFLARETAAKQRIPCVVVTDPHPSPAVVTALANEAFTHNVNGLWVASVRTGIDPASVHLGPYRDESGVLEEVAAQERSHWPVKLVGAGIPSFIVPIRPHWAAQLLDPRLAEASLFGRELTLGLSREHVYYRSPRNSGGIAPPGRIVWYVSGSAPAHPGGSVRAVSQVAEVVVGRPKTLYQRYARLGVYEEQQVIAAADANGQVMALRFVDTEPLEHPVALSELRAIFASEAMSLSVRSPREVPERVFCRIYAQGSRYAH